MTPQRTSRSSHLGAFKFLSVGRTHVGCVRSLNEDAVLNRADIGLWAVADGMGGHEGGEVASAAVVDALSGVFNFTTAYAFRDAAAQALVEANTKLVELSAERGTMGSTVVTLLAHEGHYACLWAGDSRAYLYRAGALKRLTRDHSVVQEMVDAGAITEDRARAHPRANVITRAVGAREQLEIDSVFGSIQAGDRFLLCSDGLTGVVTEREIAEHMIRAPLEAAAERLIDQALARGAPDNVSLVLLAAEPA
ncbi:MAG TPA: PP2C family serine/threonine-protein phosphatase [Vitreimonas sp.]|nr:PP2C family serine/threonine-protein phosphatase [Vitreimonas sp.]